MRTIVLLLSIALFACAQERSAPEGILDRELFKKVLTEAQLIEARVNQELVNAQRAQVPVERYYEEAFKQFQVDEEQFKRSFEYYSSRPEELRAIYDEIIAELSRRKDLPPVEEQLSADPITPAR